MNASASARILIIGIGNPLRNDDGLGWAVAQQLADDENADYDIHTVHQLTPELAQWMAAARLVIMIDASHEGEPGELHTRPISSSAQPDAIGTHHTTPEALAAFTAALYGHCPPVVVIAITGADFGIGEQLSPLVASKIPLACKTVRLCAHEPGTFTDLESYKKEDISIETHILTPKNASFEVVQASSQNEIKETVQIARQHLGENAYGLEKRLEWFRKSPQGDYVLKHNGTIVGYFSMQAIKPTTIDEVFNLKSGKSIDTDDMEVISPGLLLEVHISGMGIKKGMGPGDTRMYGMELIRGLYQQITELGRHGLEISKMWAKSSTIPGIKLCQDLGFTQLGYINNEQIGFVLDLTSAENAENIVTRSFIKSYQETLNAWRASLI